MPFSHASCRLPLLALLLVLGSASASAHAGLPETSSVTVRREHPEDMLVGSTFGLLVSRDTGRSWRWVCASALGGAVPRADSLEWKSDGTLLALGGLALWRSWDGGCSWRTHPAFEGMAPVHLAAHPSDESLFWVVVASGASTGSALFSSHDGGESFAPTSLPRSDVSLTTVALAPSDTRRVYAAGGHAPGLFLLRSDDGGDSWQELPQPLAELSQPYDLRLLLVTESDAEHLWARVSSGGRTYLLESTDGGHTLRPVPTPEDFIVGAEASADGSTLWVATLTRLLRVRDGTATPLSLPDGNACARRLGGVLYGCGSSWVHDWALATSPDEGDTWQPLFGLHEIQGPLACPAGTPTQDLCAPLWPQLARLIGASYVPPDAGTPLEPSEPSKPSSSCTTATGGAPGWLVWILAFFLARRRPRATSLEPRT